MKTLRILTAVLSVFSAVLPVLAEKAPANDMAIPSEFYILKGMSHDFFTQSFLRRWNPNDFHTRFGGECIYSRRIPGVATVSSAKEGDLMRIELVEGIGFNTIACDSATLHVGDRTRCAGKEVGVQIIGDSFVQGAFYRTALVDSLNVPGIRMIGLRRLSGSDTHNDEGRGGWTLKDYFTISKGEMRPYSGFMQPNGEMRYLGDIRFWINCARVDAGELTDFESRYQCGRFKEAASRFDSATGRPLKPRKNDLMYDSEASHYIIYDGRRWKTAGNIDESDWSFNYSKYLEIWNLDAPEFLFETLGLNDFRDSLDADYSEWDSMVEKMKESYLKARPDGHFAIVIPCSSCGSMNNRRGDFTARQNACMWRFRKHLVDTFDHRTTEGFYLVDMGITIDNENGYRTDAEGLQTGNPHPYPNYSTMGLPLAAFIQWHRK